MQVDALEPRYQSAVMELLPKLDALKGADEVASFGPVVAALQQLLMELRPYLVSRQKHLDACASPEF